MNELHALLKDLKLLKGKGRFTNLLKLCHAGRLVGGLSISLSALPDEVLGPLTHAMGGRALTLRIHDSFGTHPMQLKVACGDLQETWEVEGIAGLIYNVNDLFREDHAVKELLILGEWEDMLQVWSVTREHAEELRDLVRFRNASS